LIGDKSQQYFAISKKGQPIDTARRGARAKYLHGYSLFSRLEFDLLLCQNGSDANISRLRSDRFKIYKPHISMYS
jgi:hypothetical protein